MNIYLAGRYSRRDELAGHRAAIEARGHMVTSRWLNGEHEAIDADWREHPGLAMQWARDDFEDVADAEILILFTEDGPTPRGGRHVEFGIALGYSAETWIVGPIENIFQFLAIAHFATWADALAAIERLDG